ncbi:hypothetical protein FL966_07050 [Caproiciproducens galactitolivorans]|nr:hypothetical protein FL966_07050 [Caproiciproducens galactitolivorans]
MSKYRFVLIYRRLLPLLWYLFICFFRLVGRYNVQYQQSNRQDVKKGEVITYDMVDLDAFSLVYQLRKLQDRFF